MKLHIPLLGKILEKTIVARTMRTLGTLVASGVPILESLAIVKKPPITRVRGLLPARLRVDPRGRSRSPTRCAESRLVDDMVVNMIEVGEETGDLDTMLYKIAGLLRRRSRHDGEVADLALGNRS